MRQTGAENNLAMRRFTPLLATLVLALAACGGDDEGGGGTTPPAGGGGGGGETAAEGKSVFTSNCGSCHTLSDAGTNGQVGPNLDDVKPDKDTVLNALRTGPGSMPENVVTGADAEAVAEYVSSTAGQ